VSAAKRGTGRRLPSRDELLRYINETPGRVGKRELARAFGLKGDDRVELKRLMRELKDDGAVGRAGKRGVHSTTALPATCVIEINDIDVDGELKARPASWRSEHEPPPIMVAPSARGVPALGVGDRALARLRRLPEGGYEASVVRLLEGRPDEVLGVFQRTTEGGIIRPTDRRARIAYRVLAADSAGAKDGDIVLGERTGPAHGLEPRARIRERLGPLGSPRAISLIAIHTHGIPTRFSEAALGEAREARSVELGGRTDLRGLPLVTIDGEDARDFDDAVYDAADHDPANAGAATRSIFPIASCPCCPNSSRTNCAR
jgi:ribonuclease R